MSTSEERSTLQMVIDAHDDMEPDASRHVFEQVNYSLEKAIRAVEETGKSGSITLKIKLERDGTGRVAFSPAVEAKIPNPPLSRVGLWTRGNGKLSRVNPNQKTLEFPKPVHAKSEEN